ncbi:adhesion G-protein coupled receptor G7-like isoform X1 [Clavelina lepadiformis]|uniref:adhesion G-protein coupled receptor G7-like isoform X1 n=1 Tax=Clavelina lepadiformis TaxID=159417 RepID=UPI004042DD8E
MDYIFNFVLLTILLTVSWKETDALFCYSCDEASTDAVSANIKCNENHPMECGKLQSRCGTAISSVGIMKGCVEACPTRRGDADGGFQCSDCDTDLCNSELTDVKSSGETSIHKITLSPYTFTLVWRPATFWEANMECLKLGQSMASIRDSDIQSFLERKIASMRKPDTDISNDKLWMGAQKAGNLWYWNDRGDYIPPPKSAVSCPQNSLKYQNWNAESFAVTFPNDRQLCGMFNLSPVLGAWSPESCGERAAGFVCQSMKYNSQTVGYIQSALVSGMIYTFNSTPKNFYDARNSCMMLGGVLSNPSDQQSQKQVTNQLIFAINSTEYWSDRLCGDEPPSMRSLVSDEGLPCSKLMPFMCEKVFKKEDCMNKPDGILNIERSTRRSETQTLTTKGKEPSPLHFVTTKAATTEKIITTPQAERDDVMLSCAPENFTRNSNVFSFPDAHYKTFSDSMEKCSSGQPMASVFCGFISGIVKYDVTTLATTSCEETLEEIANKLSSHVDTRYGSPDQLSSLTANVRLLTSQPSLLTDNDVTNAVHILRSVGNVTSYQDSTSETESTQITDKMLNDIITTATSLQVTYATSSSGKENEKTDLVSLVETFVGRVSLSSSEPTYIFSTGHMDVKASKIDMDDKKNHNNDVIYVSPRSFSKQTSGITGNSPYVKIASETIRSVLEPANNSSAQVTSLTTVFITYNNSSLFPSAKGNVGKVVTATVLYDNETKVSVPLTYAFEKSNFSQDCYIEECSFYKPETQTWSTVGCQSFNIDNDHDSLIHCACSHTTSFAVVVSFDDQSQHIPLTIASQVGLIICVLSLLLTILFFLLLPDLRRIRSADIHINLCLCLLLAYLVFLIGIEFTEPRELCVSIAAVIHYFLLASWGWMAVESITMFRTFVTSFNRHNVVQARKVAVAVYLITGLVVFATMALSVLLWQQDDTECVKHDKWSSYVGDGYCWLNGPGLYFGFLLIIGIIFIGNVIMAVLVIRAITCGRTKINSSIEEPPMVQVLRAILVAVLMGMTWVFAIPVVVVQEEETRLAFAWLFTIFASLQGLFMFYFFCLRRKEVRRIWINACRRLMGKPALQNTTDTTGNGVTRRSTSTMEYNESDCCCCCVDGQWRRLNRTRKPRPSTSEHKSSSVATEMTARG